MTRRPCLPSRSFWASNRIARVVDRDGLLIGVERRGGPGQHLVGGALHEAAHDVAPASSVMRWNVAISL